MPDEGPLCAKERPDISELAERFTKGYRVIVVSNRGPVQFHTNADGNLKSSQGSGGLATALRSLSRYLHFTWIAAALSDADRQAARLAGKGKGVRILGEQGLAPRFVLTPREAYDLYYHSVANPWLWFLQHSMWDILKSPPKKSEVRYAWEEGYVRVNQAFAQAVIREIGRDCRPAVIMLQDYHLYLAPAYIRRAVPNAFLQHFLHIPWPAPEHWRSMPREIVEEICSGLLANDIVGFQNARSVVNFMRTCLDVFPSIDVDLRHRRITRNGHSTHLRDYPISVDVLGLRQAVFSEKVEAYRQRLLPLLGEQTIVRVDRLDPSKNIVRGFRAFDLLLRQRPELKGRVRFLAFLIPSRTAIPEYRHYRDEVMATVKAVNKKHGRGDWQPITIFYEDNYHQGIAAMSLYDVLLVNPLADGMNLIAKEGPIVNLRNGVLVLSSAAGAHEQLKEGVISLEPRDVPGTAAALTKALEMGAGERRVLQRRLRSVIEEADLRQWLHRQLSDIDEVWRQKTAAAYANQLPPPNGRSGSVSAPARRQPALPTEGGLIMDQDSAQTKAA